jgi:hypothetical protein
VEVLGVGHRIRELTPEQQSGRLLRQINDLEHRPGSGSRQRSPGNRFLTPLRNGFRGCVAVGNLIGALAGEERLGRDLDPLCEFLVNPAHQRAKLLVPSKRGWKAIEQIRPRVTAWAKRIRGVVGDDAIRAANTAIDAVLSALATPEGQVDAPARLSHSHTRRASQKA